MKLLFVLAGLMLWAAPLMAETYSWVDESGTYNFTEDYSRIPKKYRSKVDKRGDLGASPLPNESASPSTGASMAPPEAAKDTAAGKPAAPAGNPGDKSIYQWKQEFSEREAAMWAIRKRVDEIDTLLKNSPSTKEQAQTLMTERNKVVEQFNEMRKQYDQQMEIARKTGFTVEVK